MVSLDDAVVARLSSHGHRFEVLIDPDVAYAIRSGDRDTLSPDDLATEKVLKDAGKGDEASEETIKKVFGTTDVVQVALKILRKGEIQLTTEQRRKLVEDARKRLIATIARNAVDPRTGNPHPPDRIGRALEEAKFHVDPFRPMDEQMKEALKLLRPLLPIRFEEVRVRLRIPSQFVGGAYGAARNAGELLQEKWLEDGSWEGVIQIPAGMQGEVFEELNKRTQGQVESSVERVRT